MNRDPVAEYGGLNLYRFVGNDPATRSDPHGLQYQLGRAISQGMMLCKCRSVVQDAMYGAEAWANANFGGPGQTHNNAGSIADMLTHCVGACEVAKNEAVCLAAGINARDYLQGREHPDESSDDKMDYENNKIGLQIADSGGDCKKGCLQALAEGKLWTIDRRPPHRAHPVGRPQLPAPPNPDSP